MGKGHRADMGDVAPYHSKRLYLYSFDNPQTVDKDYIQRTFYRVMLYLNPCLSQTKSSILMKREIF